MANYQRKNALMRGFLLLNWGFLACLTPLFAANQPEYPASFALDYSDVPELSDALDLANLSAQEEKQNPQTLENSAETSYNAAELFAKYRDSVVQIQINNQATGQKTSIGSGFVVGDGDMIATNYHVVSDVLQKQEHVPTYIDQNDNKGKLQVWDFDIVNDLAILKADKKIAAPFNFAKDSVQGEALFALGNPHDLGFVIIDGINNGLLRKSARSNILFSGSLNSGMSGGPTLNRHGEVIGVNVAYLRSGSNISFIVPVEHLSKLLQQKKRVLPEQVNERIAEQLAADNQKYFSEPLAHDWQKTKIAKYSVPLAMSKDTKCWDASANPEAEDLLTVAEVRCFNDRQTYINNEVSLGQIGYTYAYIYPVQDISRRRFYGVYNRAFKMSYTARARRYYEDYQCQEGFTTIAGSVFKTVYCRQPGKFALGSQSETIDDHRLLAASIDRETQGFIIQIELYGVQTSLGKQIITKIVEQITKED